MNFLIHLSLSMTLIFFMAGCSTYKPPSISESQLAHISELRTKEARVLILEINDKYTVSGKNEYGAGMLTAPHKKDSYLRTADRTYGLGEGQIFMQILYSGRGDICKAITFYAVSGKKYQLRCSEQTNDNVDIWVEDLESRSKVYPQHSFMNQYR